MLDFYSSSHVNFEQDGSYNNFENATKKVCKGSLKNYMTNQGSSEKYVDKRGASALRSF